MSADRVVVEQTYDTSVAEVWRAITDKVQMRQWCFETMTDFKREPGFETQFNVRFESQDFLHVCGPPALGKPTAAAPEPGS